MNKDNLIFIHKLFKAFADALIKVFIPLYILKTTSNLTYSVLYLLFYQVSVLLLMFVLKKFLRKYPVISIILHFIPIIIAEGIISFFTLNIPLIILVAFIMSFSQVLYSIPLNIIFVFSDKKANVGKFQISANIGKIIFTLISGYILSSEIKNSFLIMSLSSFVFYIISVIPLFFLYSYLVNQTKEKVNYAYKKIKIDKFFILFHLCFGIFQPVMDNILPLYLFINNLSFNAVTLMIVLVEVLKLITNKIANILKKKNLGIPACIISAIIFLTSILVMMLVKNNIIIYIFSCLCSISFPLTFVTMFSLYCNYLVKTDNEIEGMERRDYEIFALRPIQMLFYFLGFSLYPVLIFGLLSIPCMLFCEIKTLKNYGNSPKLVDSK